MQPATMLKRSRDVMLAQWNELLRLRGEVLKTSDLEAIHDLRVASRRFRAALELFEPWLPPKKAALIKKSTRKLTRLLGGLRNIDEALLFFRLHTPATTGGGYQICRILSEKRPGELTLINKSLSSFDRRPLGRMVRKAADRLGEGRIAAGTSFPLATYFPDTCLSLFQPIHDLLPVATSPGQRESRHALRIAIKKWRYFFEIVGAVLGRDCSAMLGLLKEYQTILGHMNDIAVFGELCGTLALSRHERMFIEATLQAEDELLLQKLADLIERKPLTYTFPF